MESAAKFRGARVGRVRAPDIEEIGVRGDLAISQCEVALARPLQMSAALATRRDPLRTEYSAQRCEPCRVSKHVGMTIGVLVAHLAALTPLGLHLRLDADGVFTAALAYFCLFGFGLSAIESLFFFDESPVRARHWLGGIGLAIGLAGVAAFLFAAPEGRTAADAISSWFDERGRLAWFHFGYAATSFMVAYCVIGSATWPFVKEYYENPELGLDLRVPSGPVVILLQLGRGALATLALLPLAAGLEQTASGPSTWAALALSLSVTSALVPMLWATDWPTRLRVAHGIEITVFSIVQGGAWWWWLIR